MTGRYNLDNLNSYKPENDGSHGVDESPAKRTFLSFEISEEAPVEVASPVTSQTDPVEAEAESIDNSDAGTSTNEEFTIPDAFTVSDEYASQSFVQTPSAIRPTYLPRFTEVSETYRMQNDPRPRPRTDTHTVKAINEDEIVSVDLDPTTERVEEKEVKRVVVTSKTLRNPEPTDETLTVLKFSTPIDTETRDAAEPEPVNEEPVVEEPSVESDPEIVEFEGEKLEDFEPITPETPKNMTIPDPDATFSVVDFTPREVGAYEEPKGASDTEKKEKGLMNSEFNSPIQREAIKDRFLDTIMSIKVRLAGSLLLLLAMVAMDCLPYLGVDIFAAIGFGAIPHAKAIIDMQFSICAFLFVLDFKVKKVQITALFKR